MKATPALRSLLLIVTGTLLGASAAQAGNYFWDDNSNGANFGTAGASTGTWAATTAGPTAGWSVSGTGADAFAAFTTATADALNFGNGTTGLGAGTITVDGTVASGNMTFASGSGAILLSGGTINLAATTTITVNNTTNTIGSGITGAGTSLTKAGTGTLILSGSHTRSGTTAITGGKLVVRSGTLGSGAIVFATNNTTLQFQSDSNLSVGNAWTTSTRNLARTLVVDRLTPDDATGLTFTFSSQYLIDTGCNLTFSAGSNITSGTPTVNFTANTGFRSSDSNSGSITLTPNGVNVRSNGFDNTRSRTITLAGTSAGNEIYGEIKQSVGYSASIVKSGTSTWKLSGANSYVGTTAVDGGTLQVDGSLAAGGGLVTVATGGTLNVGASGSIARNVTVSGGSLGLAGTISAAGTKLTLSSGTVSTAAGTPKVATADFSAGAGTATASTPLAITSTLNLPGGTNATLTGGTSFTAAGTNLVDNIVAREISLSGGTLALNRLASVSVPLTNPSFETDTGTANNFLYLDITGWDGGTGIEQGTGRTFTPAAPPNQNASTNNKWAFIQNAQTMSQTFTVTEAGTYAVSFAYAGRPGSGGIPSAPFGPLYVQAQVDAANVTGVLIPSTTAWTTAVSTPVALTTGNHTLNFVFTNPLGGDKSSVLDAVAVTKQTAFSINLPNTNIAATASSTLDLGTAALNHTLGTLSIANSSTQLTLPVATGGTIAFANSSTVPWAGTLAITGTFVSGSSLRFGTTSGGLTPAQLAAISVPGGGVMSLDASGYLVSSDTTAPVWAGGWPKADTTGTSISTGFTVRAKTDESGSAYYVVIASGAAAPSSTQVKAGNDSTGSPALKSGNFALSANTEATGSVTGLSSGTTYDVWFVAEDAVPNLQSAPSKVSVATLTAYQAWLASNGKTNAPENLREFAFGTANIGALVLNPNGTIATRGQAPIIQTTVGSSVVTLTYARLKNSGGTFSAEFSTNLVTWIQANDPALIYPPSAPAGESVFDNSDDMEVVSIKFPIFRNNGAGFEKMEQNFSRIAVTAP